MYGAMVENDWRTTWLQDIITKPPTVVIGASKPSNCGQDLLTHSPHATHATQSASLDEKNSVLLD